MNEIAELFIEPFKAHSVLQFILEIAAVCLGVLSVWYSRKENILVYPTGLISTGIFVWLLFNWQLYGDMVISAYYFIMSIFGWYVWSRKVDATHYTPITTMKKKDIFWAAVIFLLSLLGILIIYKYKPFLNSNFQLSYLSHKYQYVFIDYFDALTTGTAFVAMWLMAKKKIEHWWFWIATNVLAIPLYFVFKKHGITGLQYIIFLIFAILGSREWKRSLDNSRLI